MALVDKILQDSGPEQKIKRLLEQGKYDDPCPELPEAI